MKTIPVFSIAIISLFYGKTSHAQVNISIRFSEKHTTTVYQSGESGYDFFRIPALLRVKETLFAFAEGRKNLSIWLSYDETLTWDSPHLIHKGWSAYSSSGMISKNSLAILFETGQDNPYEKIVMKHIMLK